MNERHSRIAICFDDPGLQERFVFTLFWTLIFVCSNVFWSYSQVGTDSSKLHFRTKVGYSQMDFDWSIAGDADGKNPNIYSELIWKNVGGIHVGTEIAWQFYRRMYLCVAFDYTNIQSGSVTDSDYASDDREDRTFFADVDADQGNSLTFIPRMGYAFALSRSFAITPFAGLTISKQHLTLHDNDESQFVGLKSTYDVSWQGWNVGVLSTLTIGKQIFLSGELSYHQLKYRGEGDWNLVETFEHPVSYRQRANGYSMGSRLDIQYRLTDRWGLGIGANMSWWKTAKGVDTLFLTNGQKPQTQFNGAAQQGWSMFAVVTFRL